MTTVTVGTSPTKLADARERRDGVILQTTNADIYVSFCGDETVNTTKGFLIEAGSPPFAFGSGLTGAVASIWAVVASGTSVVKVEEYI